MKRQQVNTSENEVHFTHYKGYDFAFEYVQIM